MYVRVFVDAVEPLVVAERDAEERDLILTVINQLVTMMRSMVETRRSVVPLLPEEEELPVEVEEEAVEELLLL